MGVIRHVYISFCSWSPFTLVDHTRVKLKWYYTLSTEKRLKINLVRKCLVPKSTYFFALNPLVIVDLSNSAWIKSYRPFYLRVLWTSYGVHHHKELLNSTLAMVIATTGMHDQYYVRYYVVTSRLYLTVLAIVVVKM
jgi:hypothetical protein